MGPVDENYCEGSYKKTEPQTQRELYYDKV